MSPKKIDRIRYGKVPDPGSNHERLPPLESGIVLHAGSFVRPFHPIANGSYSFTFFIPCTVGLVEWGVRGADSRRKFVCRLRYVCCVLRRIFFEGACTSIKSVYERRNHQKAPPSGVISGLLENVASSFSREPVVGKRF